MLAFRTGKGQVLPAPDENPDPDWYMELGIADYLIFAGSPTTHVNIAVEYLDDGSDRSNIQYDALSCGEDGSTALQ